MAIFKSSLLELRIEVAQTDHWSDQEIDPHVVVHLGPDNFANTTFKFEDELCVNNTRSKNTSLYIKKGVFYTLI